jgi:sugar lactone lactonase YvrE
MRRYPLALIALLATACGSAKHASAPDQGTSTGDGSVADAGTIPCDGGVECGTRTTTVARIIAGLGQGGGRPLSTHLEPFRVAIDRRGNVLVPSGNRLYRIDAATGTITAVAGIGTSGFSGDGGPARFAQLTAPYAAAIDPKGDILIADRGGQRVRRIWSATGSITTVAGNGARAYSGDHGPATSASLWFPTGVAADAAGNVFIADSWNHVVRKVDARTQIITTIAGTGAMGSSADGIPAVSAALGDPRAVAVDAKGDILIADADNGRVRRVDASTGLITTVAGSGSVGYAGDGGPATSAKIDPRDVLLGANGDLYIADGSNHRVRKVDASSGAISTLAGTGTVGYSGDGQAATAARFDTPTGVALGPSGEILIVDSGNRRLRRIDALGKIVTIAGDGSLGAPDDGALASAIDLQFPRGVAVSTADEIYIYSEERVRRIDPTSGTSMTVAGTGIPRFDAVSGAALSTSLDYVGQLALASGALFMADADSYMVRKLDLASGQLSSAAGAHLYGFGGDGGPAMTAQFRKVRGVDVDTAGNLVIADSENNRVRYVDARTGRIRTIAGDGTAAFTGDGGPATSAGVYNPIRVRFDARGDVLIADAGNNRVRKVDMRTGLISTIAGNGQPRFAGDQKPALQMAFSPVAIALDAAGDMFVSDIANNRVYRFDARTMIGTTYAGNGAADFSGDGGPATSAGVYQPTDMSFDRSGSLIVSSSYRVRRIDRASEVITSVIGAFDPPDGPALESELGTPASMIAFGAGTYLIADGATGRVRSFDRGAMRMSTVAGYPAGSDVDGAQARYSRLLRDPHGIAYDAIGHMVYVSERGGNTIRALDVSASPWTARTFAGPVNGASGAADGLPADARFKSPSGLAIDPRSRKLYVADAGNHTIRAIALGVAGARFSTIAGRAGVAGSSGDGGPAASALFDAPRAIAVGADGSLYVADTGNDRVRKIDPKGTVSSVASVMSPRGVAVDADGSLLVAAGTQIVRVAAGSSMVAMHGVPMTACLASALRAEDGALIAVDACAGVMIER